MKKFLTITAAAALSASMLAGCGSTETKTATEGGKDEKVAIIQLVENQAFNDMKEGFMVKMIEDGYTEDSFRLYNANGDQSTLATIVQDAVASQPDLIVTIGTPATTAVVGADSDIPNMFISVSDPIGNKIISDWDVIDHNSTGTSNPIPVEQIFELADKLTPGYKKVGMMCNPAEKNAVGTCNALIAYLDEKGIEYSKKDVTDPATEAITSVNALISEGVDIIFMPNDSSLQSYMESITGAATDAGIPTYGSSSVMPATGALASVAISDFNIGGKTAEMALQLFGGTAITDIPSVPVEADETAVNKATAEKLGVTIPDDLTVDKEY